MCSVSTGHAQGHAQCSVKQFSSHNPLIMPIYGIVHVALSIWIGVTVSNYPAKLEYCANMDFT